MTSYRLLCLECWEPFTATTPDAPRCSWCTATPAERRRELLRRGLLLAAIVAVLCLGMHLVPVPT